MFFLNRLLPYMFAAIVPLLLVLATPAQAAKPATVQNQIVIQINEDDSKKWHAVLANVRNIQAELGKNNVRIAIVAIGYGLGMVTADSLAANGVQDALGDGVEFVACGNSMKAQQVSKTDLAEGVSVATAGYVEIMRRQQQGWTYLRP